METHARDVTARCDDEVKSSGGTFFCVRVHPDGRAKSTVRDAAGLKHWLKINRTFRPMDALFVDGQPECLSDYGSFSAEQVVRIQATLEVEVKALARDWIDREHIEHDHPSFAREIDEFKTYH